MLTIDPRTGAVAQGWNGRGTALLVAAVALAVGGGAWATLLVAESDCGDGIEASEIADDTASDAIALHEVDLTDDVSLANPRTPALAVLVDRDDAASLVEEPTAIDEGHAVEEQEADDRAEGEVLLGSLALDGSGGARTSVTLLTPGGPADTQPEIGFTPLSHSAARLDGLWSCLSHNYQRARDAWDRLEDGERDQLRDLCLRHGVVLP